MDPEEEKNSRKDFDVDAKSMQSTRSEEGSSSKAEGKGGLVWAGLLLFAISLARIGSGLFISIHGPTLLTLANNVDSSVSDVSWLFSGRSLGLLVGGLATGPIMRKVDNMLGFAITSLFLGGVIIATPWIVDLWLLVIVVMIGGISFGYLDAGMQALILQVWGEKNSRGLISGYHFTIAVGAFLAPIIAQPFLSQQEGDDLCPSSGQLQPNNSWLTTPSMEVEETTISDLGPNPVVWAYLICGVFLFVVFFIFVLLRLCKIESKVRRGREGTVETRQEDSLKDLVLLFVLICAYYFFCVAGETSYSSYIYSISICSKLQFSNSDGTLINSLFWIGFGLGRLSGVVVFRFLSPKHVILVDFVGIIASMTVVSIFGENTAEVTWAMTFFYGFFQATIYPGGVSWASQFTNMSGNYIFIFSAGQALGTMSLVPVGGIIFDIVPFSVMYMVLGCSVANALVFLLMMWEGGRLKKKRSDLHDDEWKTQL
ncbi:unnamed protein product [Clavelina lepadiformis]|uniref:Sodium-dependent glucose transporter 1 n=1 Tax=Clavelina lepadiformis TaxID=159417 RepID=A0ABP0GQ83_CLALP